MASKSVTFVWASTAASVEAGTFSILAAVEVAIAVGIYWLIAIRFHTQIHLWVSVAVAPLLLLRSEASVALGVKWFNQFVDYGFGQSAKRAIWSVWLWGSATAAAIAMIGIAHSLAQYLLVGRTDIAAVICSFVVAYLSAQVGVAVAMAIAANEIAAVVIWKSAALAIASTAVAAVSVGVFLSEAHTLPSLVVVATTIALSSIGVKAILGVRDATAQALTSSKDESRGILTARGIFAAAPGAFAIFAPGMFAAGWARSVAIRFGATLCHLWAGFAALPDNWWRTLFVIDLRRPPEVVPGYKRPDPLQPSYLLTEIRSANSILVSFVCLVAFLMMFVPAYFYRITIKSTCWFYLPIIYIMRARRYEGRPTLLANLLWSSPFEWWRRLLAVAVLATLVFNQAVLAYANAAFPVAIVSPIEYIFVIDFRAIKVWQWFNLGSALFTIAIFMFAGTFRVFVRHASGDESIARLVAWRTLTLEYAMRVRNLSTFLFLSIAFCHVLLWKLPQYLPTYVLASLRSLFG